jgi:ribosomal protein S10
MQKTKNFFLLNNYNYKLVVCDFNQNLFLQKLLILQNFFISEFNSSLKIIIKNSVLKKNKKFTILKAPFVHKKAREQFFLETVFQTLILCFNFKMTKTLNNFIFNKLKSNLKIYNINYINFSYFLTKNKKLKSI